MSFLVYLMPGGCAVQLPRASRRRRAVFQHGYLLSAGTACILASDLAGLARGIQTITCNNKQSTA